MWDSYSTGTCPACYYETDPLKLFYDESENDIISGNETTGSRSLPPKFLQNQVEFRKKIQKKYEESDVRSLFESWLRSYLLSKS